MQHSYNSRYSAEFALGQFRLYGNLYSDSTLKFRTNRCR